jgi:hypothetical protein
MRGCSERRRSRQGRRWMAVTAMVGVIGLWPAGSAAAATPAPKPSTAGSTATPSASDTQAQVKAEKKAREEAAREQQASDAVTEQQDRAQAAAEAQETKLAAAGQRARASWESHGRPTRLILVKQRSIDLATDGRITRQLPRSGAALNLTQLDRIVPSDWLSIAGGTATLSAAIVLTRGTNLTLGGDVTALRLAGGESAADAASIFTGRGRLTLRKIGVHSFDTKTGGPIPPGPGRPFLVASGGRLDATDSTISDLGTDPSAPGARPGVSMGPGSTGTLLRTTLIRNSTGLKLDRTVGARLENVTVQESASEGLTLRGDLGTTLIGIVSDRNDGNGVLVTGPSSERPVTSISAAGNKKFGIALLGQTNTLVNDVRTARNAVGGLRVSWSTDITVRGMAAVGDPIGIYTHVGSGKIALEQVRVAEARRGLQVEKTTRGLQMSDSTIERSTIAGVSISGHEIELRDVAVTDSPTGLRVERGASEVATDRLRLTGGRDGIVALPATKNVVMRGMTANGVERSALRTMSPGLQMTGGLVVGGTTAVDAGAATTISDVMITQVDEGIRARSTEPISVHGTTIAAGSVGINVAEGSPTTLAASRIDALESVRGEVLQRGENTLSLPPLNLLGAIGIPLILLALVLEQVQSRRLRSYGGYGRNVAPSLPAA